MIERRVEEKLERVEQIVQRQYEYTAPALHEDDCEELERAVKELREELDRVKVGYVGDGD